MKIIFFIGCLFAGYFFSTAQAQDKTISETKNTSQWNIAVVEQHIIPAYKALEVSTEQLKQNSKGFCQKPDEQSFIQLQIAFINSLAKWQSIQHIRFGPIENSLRNFRYQLWPDKRGKVNKHLNKLLIAKNSGPLQNEKFPHGSIAIQGFSALEMLLFNKGITFQDFIKQEAKQGKANYRCKVLLAISTNLSNMSTGLVHDWAGDNNAFREFIATAEQANDYFENELEVSSNLLNNLSTQLILIVDYKLDRPLGKNIQKSIAKRAESWRSRQSLANIQNNLTALKLLYETGFKPWLNDTELKQKIDYSFIQINTTIDKINKPIFAAVKDPSLRPVIIELRQQIAHLKQLCSVQLPAALNLPLGFNSLDGD